MDLLLPRWIAWPLGGGVIAGLIMAGIASVGPIDPEAAKPSIAKRAIERAARAGVSEEQVKAILDECDWRSIDDAFQRYSYIGEFKECLKPYGLYP